MAVPRAAVCLVLTAFAGLVSPFNSPGTPSRWHARGTKCQRPVTSHPAFAFLLCMKNSIVIKSRSMFVKAKSSSLLLTCLAAYGLQAGTVVAPPGCDLADGNDGVVSSPSPSLRGQRLYSASFFTNMTPKAGVLVRMALRADRSVTTPRTVVMRNCEVRLCTTRRGPGAASALSTRFDDNLGSDTTLVFSGDVSWTTQGDGPVGGPRAFDYIFPFQRPFLYDPAKGNLLIEWRIGDCGAAAPGYDAVSYADGQTRFLFASSPFASVANYFSAQVLVVQFNVEPLQLSIQPEAEGVKLVVAGPAGWNGHVQRSSNLETWKDWFGLTFETTPYRTNDVSSTTRPQQYYRLAMP